MTKWWMLAAVFAVWMALGRFLFRPPQADVTRAPLPPRSPTRIVSLAPNVTEILFVLGLADRVVGVTQYSDYPPAAAAKPKVGTFWQPDIEAVIALKPDLVVVALASERQRNLADRLGRMGYDSLALDIWTVGDLFDAVATVGAATATEKQAEQVLAEIAAKVRCLQAAAAGRPPVKVLWVVQREPLRVAGRNTFINEIIEMAGGENAIGPTLHKYPPLGGEQVIACGAEVIIEPDMLGGDLDRQLAQARSYWTRFDNVPAVANDRIYVINGDAVSRLGPRLVQGIETVARCVRPESFKE